MSIQRKIEGLRSAAIIMVLIWGIALRGQNNFSQSPAVILTKADSVYASKLPRLKMPAMYLLKNNRELPSSINNALLPYFRPNFSQGNYWNCGQAAGVGYNFCYELNQARELPGNVPENQYSVNFTFNFMNTGAGWGVSYFSSFDILKAVGNPNLADYGGLFNGEDTRWMSGYDLYENAMHNRVREVYSIDVSNPEGLMTLKYWLFDHLNGSPHGGVANFYLSAQQTLTLPNESPEAGQPAIINCSAPAGHAMTIVGFNDSVRIDLNADDRFTNDEDTNSDGIVDMKDWEIGGFRFMNSSTNNDGYGLIMYSTFALKYGEGGIWNQEVHVLEVKESYTPLATMRIKIKHNSRNKLKLIAGISQDPAFGVPEHTLDFPIFSYQGGDQYMQGNKDDELNKTIELSLDISPLLSYIEAGQWAKFFIQVAEKDEFNTGEGEVLFFSVVDYQHTMAETISDQFPKPLGNNSLTTLSVVSKMDFDKVNITTDELLAVVPGEYSTCQIAAAGGQSPYNWEVVQPYSLTNTTFDFPQQGGDQLTFNSEPIDGVVVDLPFQFPFYSDTLSSISVFINGLIMFDDKPFPYPYFIGEETMLKNTRSIAPFMSELVLVKEKNDGVWVKTELDHIEIIWKASNESYPEVSNVNFAVKLFSDGRIETHYGDMVYPESKLWTAGISNGDNTNFSLNPFFNHLYNQSFEAYSYEPPAILPDKMEIDQNGLLSLLISDESTLFDVLVQVTDDNGVTSRKQFQVPSGLTYTYQIQSGTDDKIEYHDTVSVKFTIKNTSQQVYHQMMLDFSCNDSHYSLLKNNALVGTLAPQQTMVIDSALLLVANPGLADQYVTVVSSLISSTEKQWSADISLMASSPDFRMSEIMVTDNQNGILEPGETAVLKLQLSNIGHADLESFQVTISDQPEYYQMEDSVFFIDRLAVGDTTTLLFPVLANQKLHSGSKINVHFSITKTDFTIAELMRPLLIGKIPVLILDLDPKKISGPLLMELLDTLQLNADYSYNYPDSYDRYMSVFVCLGTIFSNVQLTTYQANKLSSFLSNGGRIYMEGRVTWFNDVPTSLHDRFNIETVSCPYYFELKSFIGAPDRFTENMFFLTTSTKPYSNYYMQPVGSAFPILNVSQNDSASTVAYDEGNYKTIGSFIEFGTLMDMDTISTKEKYLLGILDFFGLTDFMLSDKPVIKLPENELSMEVWPNPFSIDLTIRIFNLYGKSNCLQIFDLSGKMVNKINLPESNQPDGCLTFEWNAKDLTGKKLPKGLYLIKLVSNNHSLVKKVLSY